MDEIKTKEQITSELETQRRFLSEFDTEPTLQWVLGQQSDIND
jgi:hypothetical protein